jgi:purine-binding chemotaxis protein CheW
MAKRIKKSRTEKKEIQAIGLRIGTEEYGLPIKSVQEVITAPRITRVPKSPGYIRGVINLRGNVIPVIDIAQRFGIGETVLGADSRIVAVEVNDEVVGLAAESVSKVIRLAEAAINPPPALVSGISAEYLEGVARLPDRFMIFMDLQKVLADNSAGREEGIDDAS